VVVRVVRVGLVVEVGEGGAIEGGGAVEGEGGAGPGGGREGVPGGAGGLAGGLEVATQALGVGVWEALEGLGEGAVDRALTRRVDVLDQGRADALVIGLDGGLAVGSVAAQQVVAAQEGEGGEGIGGEIGDAGGELGVDRLGGDGDDLEQGARGGIEADDATAQHRLEGRGPGEGARVGVAAEVTELGDEQRVAAGLAGDRRGLAGARGVGEQRARELEGAVRAQRAQLEIGAQQAGVPREVAAQGRDAAAGGRVAAVADDQQQRRRVGRSQQLAQQRGAVDVAPVQVVEHEHERAGGGEAAEQRAQGLEGLLALLVRGEAGVERAGAQAVDRGDAAQHREQAREAVQLRRAQGLDLGVGALAQVAGEGVDQAVDALVGDALALVAAAGEDDRGAARERGAEVVEQGAAAEAGGAVEEHQRGRAGAAVGEGAVEGGELVGATDELGGHRDGGGGEREDLAGGALDREEREDLVVARAVLGLAREQGHA
jgi:hypothetical protein